MGMTSDIVLSIITPYFQTLELTKRLNKWLQPQIFANKNVEWIIVDDGCNEKELDEFPAKVIHLETNSGAAGKPRNVGLDVAIGKYITFIDSDDYVADDYVETILNKIEQSDFDFCCFSWMTENSLQAIQVPKEIGDYYGTGCVWDCIFKKTSIGENRFDEHKVIAEDCDFNKRVRKGKSETIQKIIYFYNDGREGSLFNSNSKKGKKPMITKEKFCEILSLLEKGYEERNEFDTAIEKFCDSWITLSLCNDWAKAIYELFDICFYEGASDTISWWLFESDETHKDSIIYLTDPKTQKEVMICLKNEELLYKYLTEDETLFLESRQVVENE